MSSGHATYGGEAASRHAGMIETLDSSFQKAGIIDWANCISTNMRPRDYGIRAIDLGLQVPRSTGPTQSLILG